MSQENDNVIHLDLSNLRESSMGDDGFVKEMIDLFIKRGHERLSLLKEEIHNTGNEEWISHSHALKGMAANIGAPLLRTLCATSQSLDTSNVEARANILHDIENEFLYVVNELNKKN